MWWVWWWRLGLWATAWRCGHSPGEICQHRCRLFATFSEVSRFANDQLAKIDLPNAGQVIKAVRMTSENEDLQLSGRWSPGWIAFRSDAHDVHDAAMLYSIGVS